eukprot:scaffold129939_cov36-Tisochrysis_lutea.AAC.1
MHEGRALRDRGSMRGRGEERRGGTGRTGTVQGARRSESGRDDGMGVAREKPNREHTKGKCTSPRLHPQQYTIYDTHLCVCVRHQHASWCNVQGVRASALRGAM